MDTNSCVKYLFRVEWTTEIPLEKGKHHRSPNIILLEGKECNLSLWTLNEHYFLSINLRNPDERKVLNNFKVTTFIRDSSNSDPKLNAWTPLSINSRILWTKSKSEILKEIPNILNIGKLTIVSVFDSMDIHLDKMYLSNLPALEGQDSSTPNSIIMTAKLTAGEPDDSLYGVEKLSNDFSKLLEQKSFSDVTLKCGDRSFSAHRNILAARSDVFAAMFQNRMAESETGIVDIRDIDSEVLDLLLKYVYTGKFPDLSVGILPNMYMAADKYSFNSLKSECSKLMLGSITKENSLDFLILADACNDKRFKDKLINSIARCHNLMEDTWLKFSERNPQLALSVYQRYVLIAKKV